MSPKYHLLHLHCLPFSGCWSESADSRGGGGAEHAQGGETPEADQRAQREALHGQCQALYAIKRLGVIICYSGRRIQRWTSAG